MDAKRSLIKPSSVIISGSTPPDNSPLSRRLAMPSQIQGSIRSVAKSTVRSKPCAIRSLSTFSKRRLARLRAFWYYE